MAGRLAGRWAGCFYWAPGWALGCGRRRWDGTPRTAALSQWANDNHWAIFDNAEAAKQYRHFLWTTAYEVPTIDDTPPN